MVQYSGMLRACSSVFCNSSTLVGATERRFPDRLCWLQCFFRGRGGGQWEFRDPEGLASPRVLPIQQTETTDRNNRQTLLNGNDGDMSRYKVQGTRYKIQGTSVPRRRRLDYCIV